MRPRPAHEPGHARTSRIGCAGVAGRPQTPETGGCRMPEAAGGRREAQGGPAACTGLQCARPSRCTVEDTSATPGSEWLCAVLCTSVRVSDVSVGPHFFFCDADLRAHECSLRPICQTLPFVCLTFDRRFLRSTEAAGGGAGACGRAWQSRAKPGRAGGEQSASQQGSPAAPALQSKRSLMTGRPLATDASRRPPCNHGQLWRLDSCGDSTADALSVPSSGALSPSFSSAVLSWRESGT